MTDELWQFKELTFDERVEREMALLALERPSMFTSCLEGRVF